MNKETFSKIINDLQEKRCTNPLSVSSTKNPKDEMPQQTSVIQEKFLTLSENTKDKLVSPVTSERIKEIGSFFNLQLPQLADISRVIRGYYFSEIRLEDFSSILAKEIPVDMNTAQQISKQIIEKIIKDESLGVNKNLIDSSISEAIKRFPNLGEQAVTSAPIKLKIFPSPVRPSVKNWIEDYRGAMGAEKHGMMERGNYLFHSENGKRLAPGERKKLAEILRSLDEEVTLKVDPERQEIVFEESSGIGSAEKMSSVIESSRHQVSEISSYPHPNPLPAGEGELRFSSPHTLPSEKEVRSSRSSVNESSVIGNRMFTDSSQAGKLREPRISGNVVDLKN